MARENCVRLSQLSEVELDAVRLSQLREVESESATASPFGLGLGLAEGLPLAAAGGTLLLNATPIA